MTYRFNRCATIGAYLYLLEAISATIAVSLHIYKSNGRMYIKIKRGENMFKREKYDLEFKEKIVKTFLKTVSAFSNYNDGKIIFGINDEGDPIELETKDEECLKIENMINDTLEPVPKYKLEIKDLNGKQIIILSVFKGKNTPYYYKGKAYRRSNTSTLEVDRLELNRLVIQGINTDYEENKASNQKLKFNILESKLKKIVGIDNLNLDIMKTLNLYNKDGYYNIAGELLADENDFEYSGIDIVRFGKDINQILYRQTLSNKSVLSQYDKTINVFERYYKYEEIEGYERVRKELIPKEAFRESLANAIVHRVWDVKAHIQISMYKDRIEINSPGGLPAGISKKEYLSGNLSILRNPIIAGVFYRLNLIEQFGTGVMRIIEEYRQSMSKAKFEISENNTKIILPVIQIDGSNLSEEEVAIYNILKNEVELTRRELDEKSGFNKSKTLRIINGLIDKNLIRKLGSGPSTTYVLN